MVGIRFENIQYVTADFTMKKNHSPIILEHIAMQVFIWLRGKPVPVKITVLTLFQEERWTVDISSGSGT
jgi:hypothetical protein